MSFLFRTFIVFFVTFIIVRNFTTCATPLMAVAIVAAVVVAVVVAVAVIVAVAIAVVAIFTYVFLSIESHFFLWVGFKIAGKLGDFRRRSEGRCVGLR